MLDKSVPYYGFYMKREPGAPLPGFSLPAGFHFEFYKPGDEGDWAAIETSVLEFDGEGKALAYFQKEFLPFSPELPRRCIFIVTGSGEKVGTATAWWGYTGTRRNPMVHWVAVKPGYQGKGLGKALIGRVTRLLFEIEGDRAFFLHTQTWSHRAVRLYLWAGFKMTGEIAAEAIEIFKSLGIRM